MAINKESLSSGIFSPSFITYRNLAVSGCSNLRAMQSLLKELLLFAMIAYLSSGASIIVHVGRDKPLGANPKGENWQIVGLPNKQ